MPYRRTAARLAHAEGIRSSIIDAAAGIIREAGIDALTVRSVVDRSGTSTGNYYHYFGNKESLLLALVERVADRMAGQIDGAAAAAESAGERLSAMVETGVTAALEDRALTSALFSGAMGDRARGLIVERFLARTESAFRGLSGFHLDPALAATLWQGSILMLIERALSGDLDVTPGEAGRACAEWNLRALGLESTAHN